MNIFIFQHFKSNNFWCLKHWKILFQTLFVSHFKLLIKALLLIACRNNRNTPSWRVTAILRDKHYAVPLLFTMRHDVGNVYILLSNQIGAYWNMMGPNVKVVPPRYLHIWIHHIPVSPIGLVRRTYTLPSYWDFTLLLLILIIINKKQSNVQSNVDKFINDNLSSKSLIYNMQHTCPVLVYMKYPK